MSELWWFCNNSDARDKLLRVRLSSTPDCVWWKEQNTVYYNSLCKNADNDSDISQSGNPYFLYPVRDACISSIEYMKTLEEKYSVPNLELLSD